MDFFTFVGWAAAHWGEILAIILACVGFVQAIQAKQYQRLLPLAAQFALAAAKMADLDNDEKRQWVTDQLAASSFLAKFLTKAQIERIVEDGWHLIAKPQTQPEEVQG